jgi:hypothetical protein
MDHSTFSKGRAQFGRRDHGEVAFRDAAPATGEEAIVDEHFSVDGTLIEASASMKRSGRRGGADA